MSRPDSNTSQRKTNIGHIGPFWGKLLRDRGHPGNGLLDPALPLPKCHDNWPKYIWDKTGLLGCLWVQEPFSHFQFQTKKPSKNNWVPGGKAGHQQVAFGQEECQVKKIREKWVAPFLFALAARLQVRMMSGVVSERADTGAGGWGRGGGGGESEE